MGVKLAIQTAFTALDHMTGPMAGMAKNIAKYSKQAQRSGLDVNAVWGKLKGILAGLGLSLSVGAAVKALTGFADHGDEVARMANILGITTDAMQEYNYVAKMSDMTSEDLAGAFKKMNNNMGQLKTGTGSLYTFLKATNPQLALQLKHTNNTEEAVSLLTDAIAKETDISKRAALTQAAFGRGGQGMIEAAAHMRELREEFRKTGAGISPKDIAAAAEFHETLKRLTTRFQGFLNVILGAGVRAIGPWLDKLEKWLAVNKELIKQKIEDTIKWIVQAVKDAYNIFTKWWPVIRDVTIAIVALNIVLKAFAVASAISKGIQIATAMMALFTSGAKAATVAQLALNTAQQAGMLGGAGGKIAQAAVTLAAGGGIAGAAGMAAAVVGPAAMLAAVYYGASRYAKNPTPENLNPNNALLGADARARMAASPASPYLSGIMNPALAGALNKQSTLDITLNGFPAGTSAKVSGSGAPAISVGMFNTLAAGGAH